MKPYVLPDLNRSKISDEELRYMFVTLAKEAGYTRVVRSDDEDVTIDQALEELAENCVIRKEKEL